MSEKNQFKVDPLRKVETYLRAIEKASSLDEAQREARICMKVVNRALKARPAERGKKR